MSINSERSKFLVPAAILVGFVILLGGMIWALNAFSFKVATLDLNKVVKESSLGQEANKELQNKGNQLKAKLQSAKTEADKAAINTEFQKFQSDQQTAFFEKVKKATADVAKANGIKAVSSPQVFIYSTMDITDAVIAKLDK
jgi:Skp family chaperone for outer membrane proteins